MVEDTSAESVIWLLCGYPKIDNILCTWFVVCQECKTVFSIGAAVATSGAKRRVIQKHKLEVERLTGKTGQSSITSFGSTIPKKLSDPRRKEVNGAIYAFMIENLLPASILNSTTFRDLIQVCLNIHHEPNKDQVYSVEDRRTFARTTLPALYETAKENVIKLLKRGEIEGHGFVGGISFDEWKDTYRKVAYINVTAHFLDEDFKLFAVNLGTKQLFETNSWHIAEKVQEVCSEFNINPSKCLFVTDSGSNVKAACLSKRWKRVPCLGHDLNLLVQADFLENTTSDDCKEFDACLTSCRDVVALFKRGKGQNKLEEMRKLRQLSPCSLKLDVSTRWNSALHMVSSVVENYYLIVDILAHDKRHDLIAKLNFDSLKSLLKFLKPFEDLTRKMSGDKYITMPGFWSSVVNLQTYLNYQNGWQDEVDGDPTYLLAFNGIKDVLKEHTMNEVGRKHRRLEVTKFHKLAAVLDPRYKSLRMADSDFERSSVYKDLKDECTEMMAVLSQQLDDAVNSGTFGTASKPSDQFMDMGESETVENIGVNAKAEEEVNSYIQFKLSLLNVSKTNDDMFLQSFWCNEGRAFPTLRQMARKYLSPPVTSTSCERLFSKSSHLVTEKRSMLLPKTVDMILFLQQNMETLK